MKDALLPIYNRLPNFGRTLLASMHGHYLKWWRYGPETERLVSEALERETWNQEQWKSWQQDKLSRLLHRAATQVPFYRQLWIERRQKGDRSSWEDLANWPLLEKEAVRTNARGFLADDVSRRRMYHLHTSGTSGKPIDLWWSKSTVRQWYALFETRWRRWYGVSLRDRWAILGGQLVTPAQQTKPPFWVWNAGLHQLYMSSYHLAPDFIPSYLDALKRYEVQHLWGYTSSLHALAQEILRLGRKDLKMKVVVTNAEPVFDYQRSQIAEAFQCPVRESYGMAEAVTAASECAHGRLHMWPEVGITEVLQNEGSTDGEFVCTGLLNFDMILIRYRLGDRGTISRSVRCECGRLLPQMQAVEGRMDDVLYTSDGRRIGRLDPVFKAHLPVREAQIIQETLNRVRVRYVPAPEYTDEAGNSITKRLQERMGPIEVILEAVDQLPRTSNGKFRAVISKLAPDLNQNRAHEPSSR
jgi:phenylacetate-CoA ligase